MGETALVQDEANPIFNNPKSLAGPVQIDVQDSIDFPISSHFPLRLLKDQPWFLKAQKVRRSPEAASTIPKWWGKSKKLPDNLSHQDLLDTKVNWAKMKQRGDSLLYGVKTG